MSIDTHYLGRVDYLPTYEAMQAFTASRKTEFTHDNSLKPLSILPNQLWICEHFPIFTQGLAGKPEHLLLPGDIPVVSTNRGGQITYHGPGQVVAYPLIDLKRAGYFVKEYVFKIEESVIKTLAHFGVTGHRVRGAPGIYVRMDEPGSHARLQLTEADLMAPQLPGKSEQSGSDPIYLNPEAQRIPIGKIAALGIKVSHHCTYHGVALNVAMDLEPFSRINPCGYAGLKTTDLAQLGVQVSWDDVAQVFAARLCNYLTP